MIEMKRNALIFLIMFIVVISSCTGTGNKISEQKEKKKMSDITGKKILFVIASNNFRDEELQIPKQIIETKGAAVIIASSSLNISHGVLGAKVKPDILITEAKAVDYDAIVFIGGSGSSEYWNNPIAHQLAKDIVAHDKVLAAICIAPVTLANAGVLIGKKATVFASEINSLKNKGSIYTGNNVEVDGKIITANGPQSAAMFGHAIVTVLMGQSDREI